CVSSPSDAAAADAAVREAIDLRRLPWIRPLVDAYARDFNSVASLFTAGNPADPSAWQRTIERVRRTSRDRHQLRDVLTRQLPERGAPPAARTAAQSLGEASTVAIVTGQQAGIYGGPLYTLLKAVTTIQLARRVQAEQRAPVVPVFWVDADDH